MSDFRLRQAVASYPPKHNKKANSQHLFPVSYYSLAKIESTFLKRRAWV